MGVNEPYLEWAPCISRTTASGVSGTGRTLPLSRKGPICMPPNRNGIKSRVPVHPTEALDGFQVEPKFQLHNI